MKDTVWDTVCVTRVINRIFNFSRMLHGLGHGLGNPCKRPCTATFQPNFYSEICIVVEMLHYTVYYTGRIGRVANRVFDLRLSELCFCWKLRLHDLSHGLPRPCSKPCGNLEKFGWIVCYTVDYTGYPNRVQSRVFTLDGPSGLHGQTHGLHKPCPRPCLSLEIEYKPCLTSISWWEEFH